MVITEYLFFELLGKWAKLKPENHKAEFQKAKMPRGFPKGREYLKAEHQMTESDGRLTINQLFIVVVVIICLFVCIIIKISG